MDFIYALAGISRAPENLTVSFHNADGDLEFTSAAMRVDGVVGLDHTSSARRSATCSSR